MSPTPRGPLPGWFSPAAAAASLFYGTAVRARNSVLDRGIGVRRVDRPVVSIGNIVAGGTGKSPLVRWVAQRAIAMGIEPMIALRGYRSREGRSDEADEHRMLMPQVPLAVGANRHARITQLLAARPGIAAVILDDGFQHRRLARDLDIVLVDGQACGLAGGLLPRGWLREPSSGLRRAHAVVVTRATKFDGDLARVIEAHHGAPPVAWCNHQWDGLLVNRAPHGSHVSSEQVGVDWLAGKSVAAWAGIARPSQFVAQIEQAGARVVAVPSLRDHASYTPQAIARLARQAQRAGAQAIVMSAKDWVKVSADIGVIGLPVAVAQLSIHFHSGEERLVEMLGIALRRGSL